MGDSWAERPQHRCEVRLIFVSVLSSFEMCSCRPAVSNVTLWSQRRLPHASLGSQETKSISVTVSGPQVKMRSQSPGSSGHALPSVNSTLLNIY